MELEQLTIKVRNLEVGNVVLFGNDIRRTVRKIRPSSVDPVNLIYFKETDESIAKAPNDLITIEVKKGNDGESS
jgi:hypothetical protein